MKQYVLRVLGAIGVVGCVGAQAQSDASSVTEALTEGEIKVNFRLRYEDVQWQGLEDSAALTLRSRLSYTSKDYSGFGLTLEMDDVHSVTDVDYRTAPNDPNNSGTAVIPDPEGSEVNQAYLSYKAFDTEFRYGRQRILLDNQRFVGGVGWRQNEQTYDAFSLTNQSLDGARVFYAYLTNVNRIFGEQNPIGDHKHESHLVNVNYSAGSIGSLSAYAYLLDNVSAPGLSSDTYGARWMGKAGESVSYNLEYAVQSDAGDNPVSYDADYLLAEVKASLGPVKLGGGIEVLGSDGGTAAFTTSLATLHKFQGWTDRFLGTPANGVEDLYISAGGTVGGVKLTAVYHDLSADVGGVDYGQELDISAAKKFGPVTAVAKYADYQADDFASDTQKLWLMLNATF